ncbi:MAG TPA: AAA domain-containing protein [Acidimicrobiales bacterium]|nr:AAA domain-containing protein [Acidimicrobiales bacterium]
MTHMNIDEQRMRMVGPTARLVEFLRELARTGRPPVRSVDRHPVVRWLYDLPAELTLDTEAGPGETVLSIDPVASEPPPSPPAELEPWLSRADIQDSALDAPELPDAIPDDARDQAVRRYRPWVGRWQVWAEADRLLAPRRSWYEELARAGRQLEQQDDMYELVIGTGLLTWSSPTGDVRHPLLTTRVDVRTDAATGRVDVVVPDQATTSFGDRALLEGQPDFDSHRPQLVRDEIRSGAAVPLGDHNKELLARWQALALRRALPYEHSWKPSEAGERGPDLRFAPALILRERDRTSLIDYFDRMLEALSGPTAAAPLGLAQLLAALEPEDRLAWLEREGATDGGTVGGDPLFPLPVNPEQRQIIDRLRTDNGVVVLGPPGTGKTHTIANLLSALLARGQRVLVTSQKAQALRVLREKLPPEIQKLCVSMTDVARGGSRELDESVTALSDRYSTFSVARHEEETRRRTAARDTACQRVAQLTERIRALRAAETEVHPSVADGYEGTKARIAERLHGNAPACDWMPTPLPADAPFDPPLRVDELVELRGLLASRTPERVARLRQLFPDLAAVPTGVAIQALVDAETAAATEAQDAASELSMALSALDREDLAAVRTEVDRSQAAIHALGLGPDPGMWADDWRRHAVGDALARRELGIWHQLAQLGRHAAVAQDRLNSIGLRTVALPQFDAYGPGSFVHQLDAGRALAVHLAAGSQLRKRFRPAVQKRAERLLAGAAVDGAPITDGAQLDCVMATLEAEHTAGVLAGHWALVGVHLDPGLPIPRRVAQLVDLATALDNVLAVVAARDAVERRLGARGARVPLAAPSDWVGFAGVLSAVQARLEAERATQVLRDLAARFELEAQSPAAAPEIGRLGAAVAARDVDAYGSALRALAGAPAEQAEQLRCDELRGLVEAAHPVLADLLDRTCRADEWDGRIGSFPAAWAWGKAKTFLDGAREPGLEDRLAAELRDAVDRVGRTTAELAAEEAWGECLLRMSAHQEQALRSYRSNIEDRGMGTGRWAPRYAAAARAAMIEARDAVPAWIMPLRDVVDTVPPDQNSFDVVIIDEASQASIESLFLLWLAPRVIVVGDERQCAPSQVIRGELQPIFDRLDDYLADVPDYLKLAFTPKSNLFSLLQTRFGSVIRLREHFRCMPEIVGWSSLQFYADAPLVPLRQFGEERLPPLRTIHVAGAFTDGSSTRLRNPLEAEALVRGLVACLADPAYEDLTFGVVVLQGSGQVRLIEDLLEQRVSPEEWERRRLRVGTPPDFQGDERDVVFLSMVVADRRRAVTAREWQRRFNVAASRGRDQMWLFHSVTPDLLSPADLRRSLLSYMSGPPAPAALERFDDLTWDSDTREPFESRFQQRVFVALRDRGFHATPQVDVNGRRIDLVVSGAKGRLAVECDGDDWHAGREAQVADLERELELQRAGWRFWRVRESEFYVDPAAALGGLWTTLESRGIRPGDVVDAGNEAVPLVETWAPTTLSGEEGLDGLDGADPAELDVEIGP